MSNNFEVIFNHNHQIITIQVNLKEIWKDIIRKYTNKSGIDIKKVCFLYSGKQISEENSIEQIEIKTRTNNIYNENEEFDFELEKEWNDIQDLLLNKDSSH